MEDPKSFSAPVTGLNASAVTIDKEPRDPFLDFECNLDSEDGVKDTRHGPDPQKDEGPSHGVTSEADLEKAPEILGGDDKSLEEYQDTIEQNIHSSASDIELIELPAKRPDLEANISASSQSSDSKRENEDQVNDPNTVGWDGPDDPKNPMNWPAWKVKTHIFLVSAITFIR